MKYQWKMLYQWSVLSMSAVRDISSVHGRTEGEQSPEKEDPLRLRMYETKDEDFVEDFGSIHIGVDSQSLTP